jgi:hypothetical protein
MRKKLFNIIIKVEILFLYFKFKYIYISLINFKFIIYNLD